MRSFHIILQRMRHQLLQGWNSTGMSSKSWNAFLNSNAAPSSQGSWRVFRVFDDSRIKCFHLQVRNLAEEEAVPGSTWIRLSFSWFTRLHWKRFPTLWQCTLAGLFLIDPKSWVSKAFPPMLHCLSTNEGCITAPRYSVPSPGPRVYRTDWS